jgi:hypothetical protein
MFSLKGKKENLSLLSFRKNKIEALAPNPKNKLKG